MSDIEIPVEVGTGCVQELLHRLTEELVAKGAIRSPEWRAVFEHTPRHPFVPRYYRRTHLGRELLDGTQPEQREAWLAGVYSDDSLVTQCASNDPNLFTSSSSMPSLMALMLEALDVRDGHKVLEIGTGSGYNAALLCERIGSDLVTTIDIDPALVEIARQRLRAAGYTPTVAVADGADGYLTNAPYDRIIATCSVLSIPHAWIAQSRPRGVVVVNVLGELGGGLVRAVVLEEGGARGRFLPDVAYFMAMSGNQPARPQLDDLWSYVRGQEGNSRPFSPLSGMEEETFWFLAQFHFPNVVIFGTPNTHTLYEAPCLVDLKDGSWARVEPGPNGGGVVTQGGPRKLWNELEVVNETWLDLGRPERDCYGLTITPDGRQFVWLDSSDGDHTWDLPTGQKGTEDVTPRPLSGGPSCG